MKSFLFKLLIGILIVPAFTAFQSPQPIKKEQTKHVIRRTAAVIIIAHRKVKEGKVYTGHLARAIAHQRFAIRLYRQKEFFRSIHHSRRARFLAIQAIKANKGAEMAEWKLSKEDEAAMSNGPSDGELDKNMLKAMPEESMKDEDLINSEPGIDLRKEE